MTTPNNTPLSAEERKRIPGIAYELGYGIHNRLDSLDNLARATVDDFTEWFQVSLQRYEATVQALVQQLADAQATTEVLREALKRVEWSFKSWGNNICPACTSSMSHGHGPNCVLAAALTADAPAVLRTLKEIGQEILDYHDDPRATPALSTKSLIRLRKALGEEAR